MSCIKVKHQGNDGSAGEYVILLFFPSLTEEQMLFVENYLRHSELRSDIQEIRWENNRALVIVVKKETICNCSRIDAVTVVQRLTPTIPILPVLSDPISAAGI